MHYAYMLESQSSPGSFYVGSTGDLKRRLNDHNCGRSAHTAMQKPWTLSTYVAFSDRLKALRFERYMKSGSGREFAKRHF